MDLHFISVGLSEEEIEYLSQNKDNCIKASRRDLSYALSTVCNHFSC